MTKVITYGSFDMLHYGHIRLLERAKALGDYLIVGVTSDDYDKTRGKINLRQSLMERVEALKATGIPDEVIIEEYEGQKIDDIQRLGVDIFAIGSDWKGKFDYLNKHCRVVYLDRTEGVSSTKLRSEDNRLRLGIVGDEEKRILKKYYEESFFVNGMEISGICTRNTVIRNEMREKTYITSDYDDILSKSDAVYILSHPAHHCDQIRKALENGKHVLVETPITLSTAQTRELFSLAKKNGLILMESLKTAYSTAYNRLILLLESGKIGDVVSVDATCTSIREIKPEDSSFGQVWNSICSWGPTAMLPVFQILGTDYSEARISSLFLDEKQQFDLFTKVDFTYRNAVASVKVGRGVKSEGELVVSGTKGYIYVPAPWWKTDYFEVRYEEAENNRRYFYQLEGEGIRYELVAFQKAVLSGNNTSYLTEEVSEAIASVMEQFHDNKVNVLNRGEKC